MTLQRKENWEVLLYAEVYAWRSTTFVYGQTDCTAFASACINAMTGIDVWANWQGKYKNSKAAAKEIRRRGDKNLLATLTRYFGAPCPVAFARRGDLVFADLKLDMPQVGICLGVQSISMAPGKKGLIEVPTLELKRAFNV